MSDGEVFPNKGVAAPCRRHTKLGPVQAFRAFTDDSGARWAVFTKRTCHKCGAEVVRLAGQTVAKTPAEAYRNYGCLEEEIKTLVQRWHSRPEDMPEPKPTPKPRKEKPPVERPLTSWPFPPHPTPAP